MKYPEDHNCPDCGEPYDRGPDLRCTCREPLMIYIPPEEHIHISCPVHGDRKIYGGPIVTC